MRAYLLPFVLIALSAGFLAGYHTHWGWHAEVDGAGAAAEAAAGLPLFHATLLSQPPSPLGSSAQAPTETQQRLQQPQEEDEEQQYQREERELQERLRWQQKEQERLDELDQPNECKAPARLEHKEYWGAVVKTKDWAWGHHVETAAADCCRSCLATRGCNVWVWCSDSSVCGGACWLKRTDAPEKLEVFGAGPKTPWTSGHIAKDYALGA